MSDSLAAAGFAADRMMPLAGDASTRRFFRVLLPGGETAVAAWYPPHAGDIAARDLMVHRWAWEQGLPVPRLYGAAARLVVSEDLGDTDLSAAAGTLGEDVAAMVLPVLKAYQDTPWQEAPNPGFDEEFFRRELEVYSRFALAPCGFDSRETVEFLDRLAADVAAHPPRLVHRDFHANNLLIVRGRLLTIDFQDLRRGPDTYDLASLLRERGGADLIRNPWRVLDTAAQQLRWPAGWRRRYWECAAQRGLKVIGTFLRLAGSGRREYLRYLPEVVAAAREAVSKIDAPAGLLSALADMEAGKE